MLSTPTVLELYTVKIFNDEISLRSSRRINAIKVLAIEHGMMRTSVHVIFISIFDYLSNIIATDTKRKMKTIYEA